MIPATCRHPLGGLYKLSYLQELCEIGTILILQMWDLERLSNFLKFTQIVSRIVESLTNLLKSATDLLLGTIRVESTAWGFLWETQDIAVTNKVGG